MPWFCSAVHADHFTPPITGYKKVFENGAILRTATAIPGAATKPLTLYWNAKTSHSLTTTAKTPPAPGYKSVRLLGYLCAELNCGKPVPPPQPAGPVLDGLPGALQPDCLAAQKLEGAPTPPPPPLHARWSLAKGLWLPTATTSGEEPQVPSSLQHGNLKITAVATAAGAGAGAAAAAAAAGAGAGASTANAAGASADTTLSLRIERVSDGALLTEATPTFGPTADCGPQCAGYSAMSLSLSAPKPAKVYGLGQIENTSAHGGCDGNGTTASALPLARNGIGPIDLDASKFHVRAPVTVTH
jgi:hypothetical protein